MSSSVDHFGLIIRQYYESLFIGVIRKKWCIQRVRKNEFMGWHQIGHWLTKETIFTKSRKSETFFTQDYGLAHEVGIGLDCRTRRLIWGTLRAAGPKAKGNPNEDPVSHGQAKIDLSWLMASKLLPASKSANLVSISSDRQILYSDAWSS